VSLLDWGILAVIALVLLVFEERFFARGREATFRDGVRWSIGWIVVALVAGLVLLVLDGPDDTVTYLTVYAIERALSLDNLFVFLLLFGFFSIARDDRGRLLLYGIVGALALRGVAIVASVALLNRFSFISYVLAALLLYLAYKVWRGGAEDVDPDQQLAVRAVRKVFPKASAFALCLAAFIASDIAFAVDSIPAAFAITRESFLIWMANVFALVGMRSLFVLVKGLMQRFRYFDQTIGAVLAVVALKLALENVIEIGPIPSLLSVLAVLVIGAVASVIGDRRAP
jgi:tellurite resistance protein TerC